MFWLLPQYAEAPLDHFKSLLFPPAHDKYAPILWFAAEEKYYPTIPFFTAFEWQDRADTILDQQGAGEFFKKPEMLWPDSSWYNLVKTYDQRVRDQKKTNVWVFWDSTSISIETFKKIVKSDRQFWSRFPRYQERLQTIEQIQKIENAQKFKQMSKVRQNQNIIQIAKSVKEEYANDLEKIQIVSQKIQTTIDSLIQAVKRTKENRNDSLLKSLEEIKHRNYSQDSSLVGTLQRVKKDSLTIYRYWMYYLRDTGLQGHQEDIERVYVIVPPKAFVDTTKDDRPLAIIGAEHKDWNPDNILLYTPEENNTNLHVLIERGGHSCAPDLNGDGRFSPGFDANWRAENLWGTRDTQASSGFGAFGNYQSWMTLPRYEVDRCMPPRLKNESNWSYQLVALADLKAVYDTLQALPNTMKGSKDFARLRNFAICLNKIGGPPVDAWFVIRDDVRASTLSRLKNWLDDQYDYEQKSEGDRPKPIRLEKKRHMPWLNPKYKVSEPKALFKSHLFLSDNFGDWWLRGFYVRMGSQYEFLSGIELFVMEPPGFMKLPGIFVVEGGYRNVASKPDQGFLRLMYDTRYAQFFSGYFGWGIQNCRLEFKHSENFINAGVKTEAYKLLGIPAFLQLRFGVRIPHRGPRLIGDQARLELQVGFHR